MGRADTSRNSRPTTQQGASQKRQPAGTRAPRRRRQRQTPLWPLAIIILVNVAILALILGRVTGQQPQGATVADANEAPSEPVSAQPVVDPASSPVTLAVSLSRDAFPDNGSTNVLLVRDTLSPDALAAGGLQGLLNAPVLLTGADALTPETAAEIDRLGRPNIHILGGYDAISPAIEQQFEKAGHRTHRHAGPTAADTAISIAQLHFATADSAVLAPLPSLDAAAPQFGDPLTAGTLAAARQHPVLFTSSADLTNSTKRYLRSSAIKTVVVVGSPSAVAEAVLEDVRDLGIAATRIAGLDRHATAVEIARARGFETAAKAETILLVEGTRDSAWPGAFAAAGRSARENAPMLLTDGDALSPETAQYLRTADETTRIVCIAGVAEAACQSAQQALPQD